MLYMVTFTINIPPMLAYIPAPWILWAIAMFYLSEFSAIHDSILTDVPILQGDTSGESPRN